MRTGVLALVAAVLLSGCFTEILPAGRLTRMEYVCAVLDPAERVVIDAWRGQGVDLELDSAHSALVDELGRLGMRTGGVSLRGHDGPEPPAAGWNATTLRGWHDKDRPATPRGEIHMDVLWVATLGGGAASANPAPGLVAVSQEAIRDGAARLGRSEADVARAVLLHVAGHALGAVNLGIPVQDPDLQEREGPPGHDPDPASVLYAGWEDAATMAWAANATYDAYGPALHADWAAAVAPGGICAQ